jgi:hypothetical protein
MDTVYRSLGVPVGERQALWNGISAYFKDPTLHISTSPRDSADRGAKTKRFLVDTALNLLGPLGWGAKCFGAHLVKAALRPHGWPEDSAM